MASLFSDFLTALGVRHTENYSDKRFSEMPFRTMYGLYNLLREYGVASVGVSVPADEKVAAMRQLPIPFLADTPRGFAIVTNIKAGVVTYQTQRKFFSAPIEEVCAGWNGIALLASATRDSVEPDYGRHRIAEIADKAKGWIFIVLALTVLGFGMYSSGLYAVPTAWLLLALDCMGIFFSLMLVQKSLGFHSSASDAVCSVLQQGGCDVIARSQASSFLGIFKWSEVGLAYFSVSLASMLCFPQTLPALAIINILCLPYTVWSIWYQKYKAKAWCTLCVSVQCTLWLLFGAYLLGGFFSIISPLSETIMHIVALGCCYGAALLGLNRIDNVILKHVKTEDDEESTASN